MAKRWLAGVALFVLGFGSAQVMHVATADAQDTEMDEGAELIDHGDEYEIVNTGPYAYLIEVNLKPGFGEDEPVITHKTGSAVISKDGLDDLSIFRISTVGKVVPTVHPPFRICDPPMDFEDCPLPRPQPPPPGPIYFVEPDPNFGH